MNVELMPNDYDFVDSKHTYVGMYITIEQTIRYSNKTGTIGVYIEVFPTNKIALHRYKNMLLKKTKWKNMFN